MSRLHAERVRDIVLDALIVRFGESADRFEDDALRLGVAFDDGTFIEVRVTEPARLNGSREATNGR